MLVEFKEPLVLVCDTLGDALPEIHENVIDEENQNLEELLDQIQMNFSEENTSAFTNGFQNVSTVREVKEMAHVLAINPHFCRGLCWTASPVTHHTSGLIWAH